MNRYAQLPALSVLGLTILAACASSPPAPTEALQAAEIAIANAEQARVGEFAALELSEARDKLAEANDAVTQLDMIEAEYLADESRVMAELAIARADAAKAERNNQEIQQSTEVLREEMQRRRPASNGNGNGNGSNGGTRP